MLDKNKFKYFAAEKGIPLNVLATKMGMNPATLSKKLSGFTEFTRKEIQDYQKLTEVSDVEMLSIFLANILRKRKKKRGVENARMGDS